MSAGSGDFADPNLHVAFASSNCSSLEELTARNDELEERRKQVGSCVLWLSVLHHVGTLKLLTAVREVLGPINWPGNRLCVDFSWFYPVLEDTCQVGIDHLCKELSPG